MRDSLLSLAGDGDGHVLTVTAALLLAILTGLTSVSQAFLVRKDAFPGSVVNCSQLRTK